MDENAGGHLPVLLEEAIRELNIRESGKYIDCTFGRGGHSEKILDQLGVTGKLLALDQDQQAIEYGRKKFVNDSRIILVKTNFSQISKVVKEHHFANEVEGILFDLGVSSPQLDQAERGFSFMHDGPLDMRMDTSQGVTAAEWLKNVNINELIKVLKEYGQERFSKRIANAVVEQRKEQPIETTKQLADLVTKTIGRGKEQKHPATRTFQAIRMHINRESDVLTEALEECLSLLTTSGRLLAITFHSLEDQLMKSLLHKYSHSSLPRRMPVMQEHKTKLNRVCKPIKPTKQEVMRNPRARSAKLHVLEWVTC